MGKMLIKTKYKVHYSRAGFPTTSSGPYETIEKAMEEAEKYNAYGLKARAYVTKYETWAENVPMPATQDA